MGLLSFDSGARLPLAALPLAPQAAADLDSPRARSAAAPAGFRGCQYLLASESQLWHMAYRCGRCADNQGSLSPAPCSASLSLTTRRPARPGWSEGASGRQLTADLSFKRSVAAIDSGLGEWAAEQT